MAHASDIEQLTGDILRLGVIASVDHAAGTCSVKTGEIVTGDLPWLALRAGGTRWWSPPTIGEQCLLFCPEGDTEAGIVLPGLYSDMFPAPSANPDLHLTVYPDGAQIAYDSATHALTATLPAGGTARVTADGGFTIEGDVTITGNVSVSGTVTADADVVGGGVSLKSHRHGDVQTGSGQTGAPA
ncbi:phage baseplate assembly protein V [Govanella unica]|uniref:Phage baseplate assembly protein V n=1 Tax=Govanella unica TaxID=2975056 RepID=A0A9X3TW02_9PROT|nr:phage baseplate assembly protein V [Govania unica]MDA5192793.1 phage baseplate assembly protein V [Govania unica]